jgi:hypothetical protein
MLIKKDCKSVYGMPEEKRTLRRPKHRLEDNIKMESVGWIHLAQDRD